MQDPGSRILNPGSMIQDPGSKLHDPGSWSQDPGSWYEVATKLDPMAQSWYEVGTELDPTVRSWYEVGTKLDPKAVAVAVLCGRGCALCLYNYCLLCVAVWRWRGGGEVDGLEEQAQKPETRNQKPETPV